MRPTLPAWRVPRAGPGPHSWWGGVWPTVLVPVLVAGFTLGGSQWARYAQSTARPFDVLASVLLLAGPALLVVRRARPGLVLVLVAAVLLTYLARGYPVGPVFVAALVALAEAVLQGRRAVAYPVTVVTFGAALGIYLVAHPGVVVPWPAIGGWTASLVAFVAGCELRRSRRERLEQTLAAQREAERRRAGEERLGMARELHDALGHHLSLINVQAGVALYLMDDDPEQARRALTTIKASSRDLLREMRATLGVLRGVDEEPSRAPVAGLARLDALLAENRLAGLAVTVRTRGPARDLPPGVDLAAYRIVQEALTNTRRHADANAATVALDYADDGLTLEIADDGSGPGNPGSGGSGLPGMRERAVALGGTFSAGPGADRGFRVRAHLPTARIPS